MNRYDHQRMTGREFRAALRLLDMSEQEFARLTGVRYRTLERWQDAPTADHADAPPYWVSLVLFLLRDDATRSRAHGLAKTQLQEA